jgi:hypothetical protein
MANLISTITLLGSGSEWFWSALQFVVVTITLILIYVQLRVQTSSHVVLALSALNDRWNSKAMLLARLNACTN